MNFLTLDLNLLRVFDEVMAERNLTRAARNLAITQPAASNALRRLRDALGDELVTRAGYGVVPTPFALSIWPAVREALASLRAAIAPVDFDAATTRSTFVLAMADATAALLIPGLLQILESEAPRASMRVRPLTTRDPRQLLEGEEVQMAVGYFPAVISAITLGEMQEDTPDTFGHALVYSGQYVCAMRRDHPLAAGPISLDAYCGARHLLVSFSGRPFGFVDEALAGIKRTRRIVLTVNQFFTAAQVATQSDLLTILPRDFIPATGIADRLAWQPLPVEVPLVQVDMLWHRRQQTSPAHAWLRSAVMRLADASFKSNVPPARYSGDPAVRELRNS
ncbi:MAG: LysR family transcriptional regulator [Lautropia sp.]|nr:LysR family transcriptional regulator [Lautropia sp.]